MNVVARHAACHPLAAALEQPGGLSGRHVEWRQDEALFLRWTRGQVGRPAVRWHAGRVVCRPLLLTSYVAHAAARWHLLRCTPVCRRTPRAPGTHQPRNGGASSALCSAPGVPLTGRATPAAPPPTDGPPLCGRQHAGAGRHGVHEQPRPPERRVPALKGAPLAGACLRPAALPGQPPNAGSPAGNPGSPAPWGRPGAAAWRSRLSRFVRCAAECSTRPPPGAARHPPPGSPHARRCRAVVVPGLAVGRCLL